MTSKKIVLEFCQGSPPSTTRLSCKITIGWVRWYITLISSIALYCSEPRSVETMSSFHGNSLPDRDDAKSSRSSGIMTSHGGSSPLNSTLKSASPTTPWTIQ